MFAFNPYFIGAIQSKNCCQKREIWKKDKKGGWPYMGGFSQKGDSNLLYTMLSQQKEEESIWCYNQIIMPLVFHRKSISNGSEKRQIVMNKPVYFGLLILELGKILMYEFWYDYVKPKFDEKGKLCYSNRDSFILYIKADDIYEDVVEGIETRFDASSYELDKPLQKGKNKKRIGLIQDE